jgi:hypothetical protein
MRCGGFLFGRCEGRQAPGGVAWKLNRNAKKPLRIAASGFYVLTELL